MPARSQSTLSPAVSMASLMLVTRFGCPVPMPTRVLSLPSTMAFDLMCLQTRHAKATSESSRSVGARSVTTFHEAGSSSIASAV